MTWGLIIVAATFFVAYANGANDNFKGVATLFGSATTSYRKALNWATISTFAGSLAACFLAERLIRTFSGKGLVPDTLLANPAFLASVILGAGLTVLVAAKTGIPVSTTHSLTGALAGVGLVALAGNIEYGALGKKFFLPLLVSPLLALGGAYLIYSFFHWGRRTLGVKKQTCVCVGEKVIPAGHLALTAQGATIPAAQLRSLGITIDDKEACQARAIESYAGRVFGIDAKAVLDGLHFFSAGAVSFARGLNDTPKIVALAITAGAMGLNWHSIGLVGLAIAAGGLFGARKVANTVSHRITRMNDGQGFSGNLVTAVLVIFASHLGVPVSTTHVSCGALFGIGLANGKARWNIIAGILAAWLLTLPVAALIAGGCFWLLQ